jgi:hypothetical protein
MAIIFQSPCEIEIEPDIAKRSQFAHRLLPAAPTTKAPGHTARALSLFLPQGLKLSMPARV